MSSYVNPSQYNNGTSYNLQPFLYPNGSPTIGNPGGPGGIDPLSQYFGGKPSSTGDGFNAGNPLGMGAYNPYGNSGESATGSGTSTPLSDTTMLARFQAISGKLDTEVNTTADGKIDVNDLETALKDKSDKFNDADKQVIQAMIDNTSGVRGKLDSLDGNDDGVMEISNINKMVVNPNVQKQTPETKMTNTQALNTMADYMGTAIHLDKAGHRADKYVDKHGKLVASQRGAWTTDRGKLQRMADDDQVPENVRTAAKKLLENKQLLETVDTAHKGGNPDGKYSIKDFQEAINKNPDIDSIGNESTTPTGSGSSILPQPASIPLAEASAPAPSHSG